jgi:hypothetical protein
MTVFFCLTFEISPFNSKKFYLNTTAEFVNFYTLVLHKKCNEKLLLVYDEVFLKGVFEDLLCTCQNISKKVAR